MRRFPLIVATFLVALSSTLLAAAPDPAGVKGVPPNSEYVILVGGPSLYQWEKYKVAPHDHWWANFVRAARIRTEQVREQLGPNQKITWLVYKQGYLDRGAQEHMDLINFINSVRDKFDLKLVWFHDGNEVIDYLNNGQPRDQVKICGLEFFGHSNKACFMFDYSSNVDSSAKSYLHESMLRNIRRGVFTRYAYVRSWGCHTGESMSQKFREATGLKMIGAIGKTQYMMEELPILISDNGRWTN